MKVKQNLVCSLHNRFDFVKINPITGEETPLAFAENIILDYLWTSLIQSSTYESRYFDNIAFGSGTGTLSASRTSLFSKIAAVSGSNALNTLNRSEGWMSRRKDITLTESQYVGSVISEVGLEQNLGPNLCTHALLKDMNGNTTTITKTDQDIIKIYATVYFRWSLIGYQSGKIIVPNPANAAFDYNFVEWVMGGYIFSQGGNIPQLIFSGTRQVAGTAAAAIYGNTVITLTRTYNVGNKTVSLYARLPVGSGNTAHGIRSVAFSHDFGYMATFSADVKDASFFTPVEITAEALGSGDGSKTGFKTAFPYIKSGAKIYVDGTEQTSGVTVHTDIPANNDLATDMILIDKNQQALSIGISTNAVYTPANNYAIYENPRYATKGIYTMKCGYGTVHASDDGVTWDLVASPTAAVTTVSIPSQYRYKRYWKVTCTVTVSSYGWRWYDLLSDDFPADGANVVFDTAPANGAVITADYTPGVVAKDVNHVFDFTFTMTFAEYTP